MEAIFNGDFKEWTKRYVQSIIVLTPWNHMWKVVYNSLATSYSCHFSDICFWLDTEQIMRSLNLICILLNKLRISWFHLLSCNVQSKHFVRQGWRSTCVVNDLSNQRTSNSTDWNSWHLGLGLLSGRDRRGRMVVGFTTTYAISAYHH
jgi:hypothetical protein